MELEKLPHKKKTLEGRGCKALFPDMEEELVSWNKIKNKIKKTKLL